MYDACGMCIVIVCMLDEYTEIRRFEGTMECLCVCIKNIYSIYRLKHTTDLYFM